MKENEHSKIKETKKKKQKNRVFILVSLISSILASLLLFLFALAWQGSTSAMAICNGFFFSGFFLFTIGWIVLMLNNNIFSPLIYGTKSTFLMFVGKKPSLSYYEYVDDIKQNPISKVYIFIPMLSSIPNFIVSFILTIILW